MRTVSFMIIDGSSYFYRAYYALPLLVSPTGEPTGAIYGVIHMLRRLKETYQPDKMVVIFDKGGRTFRHELYPDYKVHRIKMPNELSQQFPCLLAMIKNMGLPCLQIAGFEADDVIATLAKQATAQGWNTVIATSDKDLMQLVDDHVTLLNASNDLKIDKAAVIQKFGVPPERIVDYLALVGDAVDHVPGIPSVGTKTAVKWLSLYGDLQGVIDNASMITGKVGEQLRRHLSRLNLNKVLVTVRTDVDLPCQIQDLIYREPDYQALQVHFKRLAFRRWLDEWVPESSQNKEKLNNYRLLSQPFELEQWIAQCASADVIALDTETTGLNVLNDELVGISMAIGTGQAVYIPIRHDKLIAPQQIAIEFICSLLNPLLNQPNKTLVLQNIQFDKIILAKEGINLPKVCFDTMLASYILSKGREKHDLSTLALKHLNKKTIHFSDIAGKGAKQLTFNQIELDVAREYAAEDADMTWQLYHYFHREFLDSPKLYEVFQTIDLPLVAVLIAMIKQGVLIDCEKLRQQSEALDLSLKALEENIYAFVGKDFNLSSPKQLQDILYQKLGMPILEKTPTGQASTAESVLQELALTYPFVQWILTHRSLSKLKSTYTDALPKKVNPHTGRVHTSYNQAITSTGRLTSTDPNLQNIPIRTQEGRQVRQAFIAAPGYQILAADYSQIELRIMAHFTEDPGLCTAFSQGIDVHRATASEVFSIPIAAVTSDQRRQAKAINFGLLYGMSSFGLAKQLGLTREKAHAYITCYFERYPGVKIYMNKIREQVRERGYVETLFGRRLYLPDIYARQAAKQKAAERAAINAPLQGTAADLIKIAMIRLHQHWGDKNKSIAMIMQVHDELVFEVETSLVEEVTIDIRRLMTDVANLHIPLEVDIGSGDNWDQAHSS